jgi:hypothetical protein
MVIKFVTMILGSIAINAYATPQEMVQKCSEMLSELTVGLDKDITSEVINNKNTGAYTVMLVRDDGAGIAYSAIPDDVVGNFAQFPLQKTSISCETLRGVAPIYIVLFPPSKKPLGSGKSTL